MDHGGYHDRDTAPLIASAATLAIGLFFIFVWAPHPWGWNGIDQYHTLALALARGEGFGTTDVPWGYAYFLSGFYRASDLRGVEVYRGLGTLPPRFDRGNGCGSIVIWTR